MRRVPLVACLQISLGSSRLGGLGRRRSAAASVFGGCDCDAAFAWSWVEPNCDWLVGYSALGESGDEGEIGVAGQLAMVFGQAVEGAVA
jgi:hypothetical protein